MDRGQLFEDYFTSCKEKPKQICGQGEKNSSILIIGKESTNVSVEQNHQTCEKEKGCGCFPRDRRKPCETWSKYQKLIEAVYRDEYVKRPCNKKIVDFERFAFTTELSSDPRDHSSFIDAKPSIEKRLKLFRTSEFIQSFPVVVLACGGYIRNQGVGDDRQIDNTFNVEYDGDGRGNYTKDNKGYSLGNWFYTHHNRQDTQYFKAYEKLVIHTRQLSGAVNDKLIEDMAEKINDHLLKLGLL